MRPGGYRVTPRTRSVRGGINSEHSTENASWSAGIICRICLQTLACVASLVLGFRLSRESLFLAFHLNQPEVLYLSRVASEINQSRVNDSDVALRFPYVPVSELDVQKPKLIGGDTSEGSYASNGSKSSRVHVGRHEILVRPWPHPDPEQMLVAHNLILRIQEEQRRLYGSIDRRRILAITPTYARTFQTVHLTGLIHTLSQVPGPVTWIVVEAGGVSNETAELLASASDLDVIHLSCFASLPKSPDVQSAVESRLRLEGLRYVRNNKLTGIVVFADESNSYSLDFFEEVQKVHWLGAVSVGILDHAEQSGVFAADTDGSMPPGRQFFPVQGPACNSSGHLFGWHTVRHSPGVVKVGYAESVDAPAERRSLEWAGFVLNAEILWHESTIPSWIRKWGEWIPADGFLVSPTQIAKDEQYIEPLGNCGRNVLLWWLRVEARADSKHPHKWIIDPPLELLVPSKRTPWPDPPPPPSPDIQDFTSSHPEKRRKQSGKESKSKGRSRRDKKKKDQPRISNEHQHGTDLSTRR